MANELYGSIMRGGVCYGGVGDPAVINQVSDNIAPKQATNTASELIPAGKYFVNSEGKLCQCDIQIASGGNIVVGSNCHLIPDGGVNELNSKIPVMDINYHFKYISKRVYEGSITAGQSYEISNFKAILGLPSGSHLYGYALEAVACDESIGIGYMSFHDYYDKLYVHVDRSGTNIIIFGVAIYTLS